MGLQHAAHHLASQGRGPDDTLVHMSRREVQSLQDIARANGGSLSINPDTGLVEAGFLSNLLPMIAGAALTATTGIPAWAIGLGVGGAQAARTGSLEKGLMAGLGAYGGSGLMTGITAAAGNTASELAAKDIALGGQGGSSAAAQYMPSASENFMSGVKGLGTEAGRSAAINAMGGGLNAAKTAGMALSPVLTDTGEDKAPPSDNEQYQYDYDPGRVEDPNAGYTGAYTGERTYFRPSFTRLPNTKGFADGGAIPYNSSGVAFFDDGGATDDKARLAGIQNAAAAQNYRPFTGDVPFVQKAVAQAPAGSIQPVATNPYYTMTGQSADAYRYLMGLGPQPKSPTTPTAPVITDAPVVTREPVVTNPPVVTSLPVITDSFTVEDETTTEEDETTTEEDETTTEEDETTTEEESTTEEDETTTEEEYSDSELTTFEEDETTTEEESTTEEEYTTEETTSLSIYEKEIITSIPDGVTIEDFTFPDLTFEEVTVSKEGYVDILPGDADVPEVVGPRKGGGGDLDEEFDKYLVDTTSDPFGGNGGGSDFVPADPFDFGAGDFGTGYGGGASGGGKYFDDMGNANMAMARGGVAHTINGLSDLGSYSDGGRLLRGPGDGVSDSIPATIGNKQPARLADGEFVIPARIVSELGNGSTEAGARKLYAMMDRIQKARSKSVGKGNVAKNTRADRHLPA